MASLPCPVFANNILAAEPGLRNGASYLPSPEKAAASLSYQRYPTTTTVMEKTTSFQQLHFSEALSILCEDHKVDSSIYAALLQECIRKKSLSDAQAVQAHMIKSGFHEHVFLSTFLVNVYSKCGHTDHARKVFDSMSRRNIVSWTSLMTGYAHNSQFEQAVNLFCELLEIGCYPTNYTFGAVLSACTSLGYLDFGKQIHGYILKYKIGSDTSIGNALCSLYSKSGDVKSAQKIFEGIPDKNVISWTTIISSAVDNGESELGLRLFVEMLMAAVEPNDFTLTSVLSACCVILDLGLAKQIHSFSIKTGLESNLPVTNSVMYTYLKCSRLEEARHLFNSMETMSLITWNAMIAGHAQLMDLSSDGLEANSNGVEALKIYLKLNRSTMKPDLYSFSSILSVCSNLVAIEQGEQVHAQMIKSGFLSDVVVGSALVNMYTKCGSIEKAIKAFVEMPTRTTISWTSMINGYAQHGLCMEALQLFEEMRLAGVRPNKITIMGVLSACSHARMVNKGQYYFKMMKNEYNIEPTMDHYACMVDMYVKAGRLNEAHKVIKGMRIEPNEFIWSLLLGGCRSHGDMELGTYAAERLLELEPKDTATYVMLLNMYMSAGRWKDVSRVKKLMKDHKLGKLQDLSWISLKDKVYSFRADDRSNYQTPQIYALLSDLLEKAKSLGYEADKHLELEDVEGEEMVSTSISHHSEKLAVAFGLINTLNGVPIRVVKNLRVCGDCHSAVKAFSTITQREIIIRDSKRLHIFSDGRCSCGEF